MMIILKEYGQKCSVARVVDCRLLRMHVIGWSKCVRKFLTHILVVFKFILCSLCKVEKNGCAGQRIVARLAMLRTFGTLNTRCRVIGHRSDMQQNLE